MAAVLSILHHSSSFVHLRYTWRCYCCCVERGSSQAGAGPATPRQNAMTRTRWRALACYNITGTIASSTVSSPCSSDRTLDNVYVSDENVYRTIHVQQRGIGHVEKAKTSKQLYVRVKYDTYALRISGIGYGIFSTWPQFFTTSTLYEPICNFL